MLYVLKPINFYIQKLRGTLKRYFEKEKTELLEKAIPIRPEARAPNKVLWWRHPWVRSGDNDSRRA